MPITMKGTPSASSRSMTGWASTKEVTWEPGDEAWPQFDGTLSAPIGAITSMNGWKASLRSPSDSDKELRPWKSSNVAEAPLFRMPKYMREGIRTAL